jgi:hypothetical protein
MMLLPPAPAAPDSRTFEEIGDDFSALTLELCAALEQDRLSPEEAHALRSAVLCARQCALELLKLDELVHAARVKALDDRCRCGWDRGSHLVEAPHLCEEDARCPGFALATLETVGESDTEPPPACSSSSPTLVEDLELLELEPA